MVISYGENFKNNQKEPEENLPIRNDAQICIFPQYLRDLKLVLTQFE